MLKQEIHINQMILFSIRNKLDDSLCIIFRRLIHTCTWHYMLKVVLLSILSFGMIGYKAWLGWSKLSKSISESKSLQLLLLVLVVEQSVICKLAVKEVLVMNVYVKQLFWRNDTKMYIMYNNGHELCRLE